MASDNERQPLFEQLRQAIRFYVIQLFEELHTPSLAYHNLDHTLLVVTRAEAIGKYYALSDEEMFILFAAAWFHDTGQLFGSSAGHEEVGVQVMKKFFSLHQGVPDYIIEAIEGCIMATKLPHHPSGLLEEILCDADTFHFGTPDFWQTDKLMQQETVQRGGNDDNWNERTRWLLSHHHYYTDYCRRRLDEGKARNMAGLA